MMNLINHKGHKAILFLKRSHGSQTDHCFLLVDVSCVVSVVTGKCTSAMARMSSAQLQLREQCVK